MLHLKPCLTALLLLCCIFSEASDTLRLTIDEAERIFVEKNALLLSQKFYIDEAKANAVTAKLWQNPNFHFEIGAYNNTTKKAFDFTNTGQQLVNVEQLFYLAGKRNKRIGLAKINTQIAEYQFFDLLRTLRYTLRSTFADLHFARQSLQFYEEEIPIIERTVLLYEAQYQRGNISLKEAVRLKSLLFSLQTERLQYINSIAESQQVLNILLQTGQSSYILPVLQKGKTDSLDFSTYSLAILLDSARTRRFDLKVYQSQSDYARQDFKYQKSLGVPDPTIGLTYDRASNYINNYIGPSLDIPIPVLNRNQGNVQAAKIRMKESELQYNYFDKQVQEEVVGAYVKALQTDKIYRAFDQNFTKDFDVLIDGVISNFQKRNISMIEFIDLYESYKLSTLQQYQLQNDRLNRLEELNFKTGAGLFTW